MFVDPRTVAAAGITALLLLSAGCGGGERGTEDAPERTAVDAGSGTDTIVDSGITDSSSEQDIEGKTVEELFYDDGVIDQRNSPWSDREGGQLAVCFTPSSHPVTIESVRFFVGGHGIPMKTFRVRVYRGDVSSGPVEMDLLETEIVAAASYGNQWVEIDLSAQGIIIPNGDFFVAMEWLTAPGDNGTRAQLLGADTSDPSRRSWWKHTPDSGWVRIEEISDSGDRDLMIRAKVAVH